MLNARTARQMSSVCPIIHGAESTFVTHQATGGGDFISGSITGEEKV